ncbi:MAG TPA: c-type cytochrome [Candidatus Angelobacter sp.]|nr:c-type cytochrome [Candidatus Angelobacter sp.]
MFSGFTVNQRSLSAIILATVALGLMQCAWAQDDNEPAGAKFSAEAAAIFGKRCTACHTYGKGIKVGPDLKGVTDRRKHEWLLKFIHSSSTVINSGDPTAANLFAQFKQQRMPDWTDLSEKQINDILEYIAIGGPDIKPDDERNAELAAPGERERGRRLFAGEEPLKYGARACITCHSIQGMGWGGSLGPDLTQTYLRYQDRALTEFLRQPCFQWRTASASPHYLTPKESFALKSFLRQVAFERSSRASGQSSDSQGANTSADIGPSVTSRLPQPTGRQRQ